MASGVSQIGRLAASAAMASGVSQIGRLAGSAAVASGVSQIGRFVMSFPIRLMPEWEKHTNPWNVPSATFKDSQRQKWAANPSVFGEET